MRRWRRPAPGTVRVSYRRLVELQRAALRARELEAEAAAAQAEAAAARAELAELRAGQALEELARVRRAAVLLAGWPVAVSPLQVQGLLVAPPAGVGGGLDEARWAGLVMDAAAALRVEVGSGQ